MNRSSLIGAVSVLMLLAMLGAPATVGAAGPTLATYTRARLGDVRLTLPQNAAAAAVQVGTLPTQTDVKVRWPNGSVRFAVVTTKVVKAGNYAVTSIPEAPAPFAPVLPKASVTLKIADKLFVANLPASLTDLWLRGPLASEGRAVVIPGDHPFLRVIFDVRLYAGAAPRRRHRRKLSRRDRRR